MHWDPLRCRAGGRVRCDDIHVMTLAEQMPSGAQYRSADSVDARKEGLGDDHNAHGLEHPLDGVAKEDTRMTCHGPLGELWVLVDVEAEHTCGAS